ncbi:MAG: ABC transporter permease [Gammaproteobacteria bacterium]|nr:ABC transporter permease [Gammaproteobacteria bacterium]
MTHAITIQNLHKTYRNRFQALKGIDLSVEKGDFFALLGPNGAGKSTTIGIVTSLVNKSSGKVEVFGHDLDHDINSAKRAIGLVPQEFNFNQFEPVEEIILNQAGYYGVRQKEARQRCDWSLRALGLWEKRREMARTLSGGMKRRLMIARSLVHSPELLILDEPTAGVDIELRRSMWDFLKEVNAMGTTIILTTHYLEEAEMLCRNIAIIDKGIIVENSSMKQLLATIDSETFILDLRHPLSTPPTLASGFVTRLSDPTTLEVDVNRRQGINALFSSLSEAGIEVQSMRNRANRLEELFLKRVEAGGGEAVIHFRRYLTALFTIVTKEIRRFRRIWVQTILPPMITTALYFVIFGKMIGSQLAPINGISYMDYIVPGLIMMSIITNAYANVVSSFFGAKFGRHIEELLVAPIPPSLILIGFVAGGVARGLVVGVMVTIVASLFTTLQIHHLLVTLSIVLLTAILFALAGFINAVYAKSFDDISIIPTFVLTPLIYLGGIFYSVEMLPGIWHTLSLGNPILYMINSFRFGMFGVSDTDITTAYSVVIAFIVVLYLFSLSLLKRGVGTRS